MNENLENKKAKYEDLAKKITRNYRKDMKSVKGIIEVIENNSSIKKEDTFETIVFKKYLELENVTKVAKYVNKLGYRIKTESWVGKRKYTSNDISEIIASNVKVETKLKNTVKDLFNQHSLAIYKRYC